jgi:hypothetical protein
MKYVGFNRNLKKKSLHIIKQVCSGVIIGQSNI